MQNGAVGHADLFTAHSGAVPISVVHL